MRFQKVKSSKSPCAGGLSLGKLPSHILKKTSKKLSSALFFIRKSKSYLSTIALKSLYYSLFHSVLIYCIQIWSNASPSNFACLKLKQKAAVRIVLNANYNDLTEPIFKHLNILPLDALCKFFDLQFTQTAVGATCSI
jgi:hypothetical protein